MSSKTKAQAFAKKVKAREKRYQEMPIAKKRITIAKDVIEALEANRLKAKSGRYLRLAKKVKGVDDGTEVQDILIQQPTCTACALGSMFVCSVLRNDKLKIKDFTDGYSYIDDDDNVIVEKDTFDEEESIYAGLAYLFSRLQLELIESAFERRPMLKDPDAPSTLDPLWRAICFGRQFSSASKRMTAIMKNVIANEGAFDPPPTEKPIPTTSWDDGWGHYSF